MLRMAKCALPPSDRRRGLKPKIATARKEKGPVLTGPFRVRRETREALLPATTAAATTAATAAEATTATRTAATATGAGLVLRFIDAQGTTVHGVAVERLDGAGSVSLRHFHETEAARAASLAISGQRDRLDGAVLRKQRAHIGFARRERQVAYINLRHKKQISNRNS
jgi:hypothetical protein